MTRERGKLRQEAQKRGGLPPGKKKRDPGIPNSWPIKQELLEQVERAKAKKEQDREDAKQAKKERRKPKPSSLQDRFIPSRGVADARITCFEIAQAQTMPPQHQDMNASPAKEEYKRTLASKLFARSCPVSF